MKQMPTRAPLTVPKNRLPTLNGLHGAISEKTEFFMNYQDTVL
jgi:hypothetical protein